MASLMNFMYEILEEFYLIPLFILFFLMVLSIFLIFNKNVFESDKKCDELLHSIEEFEKNNMDLKWKRCLL